MLFDSGIIKFYNLENIALNGEMPKQRLVFHKKAYYGERTIGFSRFYDAKGVNEQIDLLVRIWADRSIRIGMYAIANDVQYRISNIQQIVADDGLRVTDVTLERIDELYDVIE